MINAVAFVLICGALLIARGSRALPLLIICQYLVAAFGMPMASGFGLIELGGNTDYTPGFALLETLVYMGSVFLLLIGSVTLGHRYYATFLLFPIASAAMFYAINWHSPWEVNGGVIAAIQFICVAADVCVSFPTTRQWLASRFDSWLRLSNDADWGRYDFCELEAPGR